MKILCTGATGFFGRHVVKEFIANGAAIYDGASGYLEANDFLKKNINGVAVWATNSKVANLTDRNSTRLMIENFKPDIILHMAILCGGILANKNSPADFIHKNTDMASNIFYAANEFGCKKIYSLGSVCAYPKFCKTPFKEDDIWQGFPEETNAPYGIFKRLQMVMAQTYREQYGIGGAFFIPVNMIGEFDNFDPINSHVIPALIRKFDYAVKNNKQTVNCWGTGEATREFLYAGDSAKAIVKAVLDQFDYPDPINLGTGKDISIKELSCLIGNLMGFKGDIVFTGEVSDGQPKRLLDVSRSKILLGWEAETKFIDAIKRVITWYHQNYDEKM